MDVTIVKEPSPVRRLKVKKSRERSKEASISCFSGFKKRSTEEFYDQLTHKLIELLCYKLLINPTERNLFLCGPSNSKFRYI